jgi:hypothetical protein
MAVFKKNLVGAADRPLPVWMSDVDGLKKSLADNLGGEVTRFEGDLLSGFFIRLSGVSKPYNEKEVYSYIYNFMDSQGYTTQSNKLIFSYLGAGKSIELEFGFIDSKKELWVRGNVK